MKKRKQVRSGHKKCARAKKKLVPANFCMTARNGHVMTETNLDARDIHEFVSGVFCRKFCSEPEEWWDVPFFPAKSSTLGGADWRCRRIVVRWLFAVMLTFKVVPHHAFFRAAELFDRYTRKVAVFTNSLQLAGTACMLVACKWEENVYDEGVDVLRAATKKIKGLEWSRVVAMESCVLNALGWTVGRPCLLDVAHAMGVTTCDAELVRWVLCVEEGEYVASSRRDVVLKISQSKERGVLDDGIANTFRSTVTERKILKYFADHLGKNPT